MPRGYDQFPLRVYNARGSLRAGLMDYAEAAALVAFLGTGAHVCAGRNHGSLLWIEGAEEQDAGQSYDVAAETMIKRHQTQDYRTPEDIERVLGHYFKEV